MSWDWQPIETAPVGQLVLLTINKGDLRCPVRGDRYVCMAALTPTGKWHLFGQGDVRPGEVITHWIIPELPELAGQTKEDKQADKEALNKDSIEEWAGHYDGTIRVTAEDLRRERDKHGG